MRDGVKLHTVILVPKGAARPDPVTRTPYDATATTHAQSAHLGPDPQRLRQRARGDLDGRIHPRRPGHSRQIRLGGRLRHEPMTRNPAVKGIKDLSDKDKIAVPSVKISTQAIMLQMAAAAAFGQTNYTQLDPLTVSLSHPDATLAFINNTAGVNAHFSTSPFYEQEIRAPGAHLITTSYDILGGPATALVITTSSKFREANPKVYRAFIDAEKEAIDTIQQDKRAAAKFYLEAANDTKNTVDDINAMISRNRFMRSRCSHKRFLRQRSSWQRSARSNRRLGNLNIEISGISLCGFRPFFSSLTRGEIGICNRSGCRVP